MTIQEKYNSIESDLKHGDIILYRGSALISKAIEWTTHSYFSHSGIIFKSDTHLMTVDSTSRGVNIDFLTTRIDEEVDFCVLRPITKTDAEIKEALDAALNIGNEDYKYNYWMILQIFLKDTTGIDFIHLTSQHAYICSMFVQQYTDFLNIPEYKSVDLIVPQDYITKLNPTNIKVVVPQGL